MVYFGATDQTNLITLVISAFSKLKRNDIKLDIIVGYNTSKKKIENLKYYQKKTKILKYIPI